MPVLIGLLAAANACTAGPPSPLPNPFSAPTIVPTPDLPGSYSLSVHWNGCGGWSPDALAVTRTVSTITVTLGGVDFLGFICVAGGGVLFTLGPLPPGEYEVVFQAVHIAPNVGEYVPLRTSITIGSGAIAVPAISRFAGSVLLLAIWLLALRVAVGQRARSAKRWR